MQAKSKNSSSKGNGNNTGERRKQAVGFIYGGLIKAGYVYVFSVCTDEMDDNKSISTNINEYVRTFDKYFGSELSARFVKCDNASTILDKFLARAQTDGMGSELGPQILHTGVGSATALLKRICKANSIKAHDKKSESTDDVKSDTN